MSAALLVWDDADGAQSLWPGQHLSMMIDDASAADQLLRLTAETQLCDGKGRRISRPSGCRVLPLSPRHRFLAGQTLSDNLQLVLSLALGGSLIAPGSREALRCQAALAQVQAIVPMPAEAYPEHLAPVQQRAAQWALAWLLPHDVLWLDRIEQGLTLREREQMQALARAHQTSFPLRAQVHGTLEASVAERVDQRCIFWG
ncbi:MAG: hypothetical protein AABY68_08105 [Pseudomonadota bacterium]|mgnify:CR=1 FL=1